MCVSPGSVATIAEQLGPSCRDRVDDVIALEAEASCLDHELLDFGGKQSAALGGGGTTSVGDQRADSGPDFEQPVAHELRDDLLGCVWVDLQRLAQVPDRREGRAGSELSGND